METWAAEKIPLSTIWARNYLCPLEIAHGPLMDGQKVDLSCLTLGSNNPDDQGVDTY